MTIEPHALLLPYLRAADWREAVSSGPVSFFGIDKGAYEMWRAYAGNAKDRRRWRRRNLPNTQREVDRAAVAAEVQHWHAEAYGAEEEP